MFKQWTVGKLIALGFGVAIIVTICLNLVSLWQFKQNQKTITMLLQSDLPILSDLSHLGQEVAGLRQNEKNFLLNIGSPQDQQKYLQNFKQLAGIITSKLDSITKKLSADDDLSPGTIKEAQSLNALHQQYIKGFAMHAKMVQDNPAMTPQMANKMMIPLKETVHLIEKRLESLQHSTEEMIQENNTELISATNMTSRLLVIGLAGSILLLLIVGYAIGRKINLVLGAAITSLDGNATRLSTMAAEIAANSQSMADAATNQAASLEETSAAIEEISSQTKANASSSNQADILMRKTSSIVNQAQTSMGDLTTSMGEISSASEETSKIVKTIDDISFQTNLLALNAAVEAARAGEAGAGFAVVADEVRNLAMRAAEAAKETAVMIDETVTKIHLGRELVNRTNDEFIQVAESSKDTGTLVDEIHVASTEQVLGIDQINKTVTQLDEVVQQVAANAEESAGASQEMFDQTNKLLSTVQIISQLTGVTSITP